MLSPVWPKLWLCGQETRGFVLDFLAACGWGLATRHDQIGPQALCWHRLYVLMAHRSALLGGWALLDLLEAVGRCQHREIWKPQKMTLPQNMSRKGTWEPCLPFALSLMFPKVGPWDRSPFNSPWKRVPVLSKFGEHVMGYPSLGKSWCPWKHWRLWKVPQPRNLLNFTQATVSTKISVKMQVPT